MSKKKSRAGNLKELGSENQAQDSKKINQVYIRNILRKLCSTVTDFCPSFILIFCFNRTSCNIVRDCDVTVQNAYIFVRSQNCEWVVVPHNQKSCPERVTCDGQKSVTVEHSFLKIFLI